MEFPEDIQSKLPATKAMRISICAELGALNRIYSGRFPTEPVKGNKWNLTGVEFVRDIYSHIYGTINLDEAAQIIRTCH